jgi:neutral ceramidase
MQTGTSIEAIVLNFVHVHSGPMANADKYAACMEKPFELQDYENVLIEKVVAAAVTAGQSLRDVTVGVHRGRSNIGVNRRNRNEQGEMEMRPNTDGACNPDLWVLNLVSASGRAIVYSYGCHPVLVYGFAWNSLSADFVGVSRRDLARNLGEGTHCQFVQGLAGNVRPRVVADFESNTFRKSTPDDVLRAGTELANDVLTAFEVPADELELNLKAVAGRVLLPQDLERVPPPEFWKKLSRSDDELERNLGVYWGARLDKGLPPVKAVLFEIGLLRLANGFDIAWLGGEPMAEWQAILRGSLQDEALTVWGYCQDVPCYLPTDSLLPEGGYEAVTSRSYNKDGPAPFLAGLDAEVSRQFQRLRDCLRSAEACRRD